MQFRLIELTEYGPHYINENDAKTSGNPSL